MTMHQSALQRRVVTARLVVEANTLGFPVGNTSSPTTPFGWQGEPNSESSSFIPWIEVMPGVAQLQASQGMGDTGRNWRATYNLFYAGVDVAQTEALADKLRVGLNNITRETVTSAEGDWKIQKITCTVIGSTVRNSSAIPDYFTQTDTFEVWLTKEA